MYIVCSYNCMNEPPLPNHQWDTLVRNTHTHTQPLPHYEWDTPFETHTHTHTHAHANTHQQFNLQDRVFKASVRSGCSLIGRPFSIAIQQQQGGRGTLSCRRGRRVETTAIGRDDGAEVQVPGHRSVDWEGGNSSCLCSGDYRESVEEYILTLPLAFGSFHLVL